MGPILPFPMAALTDAQRALVTALGRRHLGLTPGMAYDAAPDLLADVSAAQHLLCAASTELLVQVRPAAAKAPRPNCQMLETPLWVSRDRRHEYDALALTDDVTRVWYAVHVAEAATSTSSVRTKDVTDVLRCIPELQLEAVSLTQTMLQQALGGDRVIRGDGDAPGKRRRWQATGERPIGRAFDGWVERLRPLLVARGDGGQTARGVSDRLEEIVTRAVKHFQDTAWWPDGRPVSVRDIDRAAADDASLQALIDALPSDRGLAVALQDATRRRPDCPRSKATLVKSTVLGRAALYDVTSLPGQTARALYPVFAEVTKAAHSARLDEWRHELREARRLRAGSTCSPATAAIADVRLVAARHVILVLRERMLALLTGSSALSAVAKQHLAERMVEMDRLADDVADDTAVRAEATDLLARIGAPPIEEVLAAEDEGLVADEVTALIREPSQEQLVSSVWAGQLKTLPYRENPAFQHRSAKTARGRSERLYDRPIAMAFLANRRNARSAPAIDRALQVVGRGPRCGALFLAAWRVAPPHERADALLALCLVDGRVASQEARHAYADANEPGATRATALVVLCVGDALTEPIIDRVARDRDPFVQSMLDACRLAQVTGHRIP